MIGLPPGVSVYAFDQPCDMRKSFNTLAAIVTEELRHDMLTGDLYLFVSRDRKRAKVLYFDGTGLCLLHKRLETGRFACLWQSPGAAALPLSASELALFLEGCALVGTRPLSPPPLAPSALRTSRPFPS